MRGFLYGGIVSIPLLGTRKSDAAVVDFYVISNTNYSGNLVLDEELYVVVDNLIIETKNIVNTDKKANIKIEAKYSDEETYTEKTSTKVSIEQNSQKNYADKLGKFKLFDSGSNINPQKLIDEFSVRIDFRATVSHIDIDDIVEETTVSIGTTSRGEIGTNTFPTVTTQYIEKNSEIYTI